MVDDYPCVTTAEAAARIGISTVRMTQLCRRGQVSGALRFGHAWMSSSSDSGRSRAGSATGTSGCAAAIITTTGSFDPNRPVLDCHAGPSGPNLLAAGSTVYQSRRASSVSEAPSF